MNSTTPITIAIPGEKRNGQQVKQFLLTQKLIQENDMNLEIISTPGIGARFIQMRANDALSRIGKGVDVAISGLDQIRESITGCELLDEGNIVGFYDEIRTPGPLWMQLLTKKETYQIPFILDGQAPTKIQLLIPDEKIGDKLDLAGDIISRHWDSKTPGLQSDCNYTVK